MGINPIYVIVGVVSVAVLAMVGVNLYLMLRARRNLQSNASRFSVLHQRIDAISATMNDHLDKHNRFIKLISERLEKDKK